MWGVCTGFREYFRFNRTVYSMYLENIAPAMPCFTRYNQFIFSPHATNGKLSSKADPELKNPSNII